MTWTVAETARRFEATIRCGNCRFGQIGKTRLRRSGRPRMGAETRPRTDGGENKKSGRDTELAQSLVNVGAATLVHIRAVDDAHVILPIGHGPITLDILRQI